jgi:Helicase conserved C-terminal domain/Type III restriction enzyme, res subunit
MAIATLEEYLREFSVEIGDRILTSFPALHNPGDPISPLFGRLLRKPFAAQEVAISGAVKRLQQADSVAIVAEMGTGKTLMAIAVAHVFSAGRPYSCLFVVPPQLLLKTAREILQTIPGARTYVIDSLRSQRPGQSGPQGVNELRLRNGRVVRDGVHTRLTDMRLRGRYKSAWERWVAEHGTGAHFFICGRDRAKLGAFWRHSFQIARCGNFNGAVVNPDSGRPIVFDGERLLHDDLDKQERFAEVLESVVLCGGEKTKPRRCFYSPLWQVDGSRIRRYAPIEFIGRYLPHFFKFGIADEVHEAKAADSAQGNALGTLAAAVDKTIVLTGTLTGGMASDLFNVLYRIDPGRMVSQGYEYGEAGIRSFTETYGVLETITTIEPQENACSKAKITKRVKERPGASPLLFGRFLMDLGAFVSLEDISANLPSYTEEVVSVPMDKPLAEAHASLEEDIAAALQAHRGNSSVISTALNALLLYPDRPFSIGPLWGVAYDEETRRRERFLIADPPDLDEAAVYAKERKLVEFVETELANRRGVQVFCTYTQKRDVTRRIETVLSKAGIRSAVLTTQTPPEDREAWYERQLKSGIQVFIAHPRLVQTGLDLMFCPAIIWYQTGYSTFTLRQASRRSWRIGQTKPVTVRFLCYENTAQVGCLRLMGRKLLVSMALEGKFSESGLQAMDDGADVLTTLARELVMHQGVGQSADEVWKALQAQQPHTQVTAPIVPERERDSEVPLAKLIQSPSAPELGQDVPLTRGRCKTSLAPAPEQMSLF